MECVYGKRKNGKKCGGRRVGGDGECALWWGWRDVGCACVTWAGAERKKGARHGNFGDFARFGTLLFVVCNRGKLRCFRDDSHGHRHAFWRVAGGEIAGAIADQNRDDSLCAFAGVCRGLDVVF